MEAFTREVVQKLPLAEGVYRVLSYGFHEPLLEELYERFRGRCYTREIDFPLMVNLIGDALLHHRGSGRASFEKGQEEERLTATVEAAYKKLARIPVAVSMALVQGGSQRLETLFPPQLETVLPASLSGLCAIVLDGKVVKRVPKRLKPLRSAKGGVLGGRALVAYHLERGLVLGMHASEDGDANDARFLPSLVASVRRTRQGPVLWMADRQYGFPALLAHLVGPVDGTADFFLVRYSKAVPFHRDASHAVREGRDKQERSYQEEWGWLGKERNAQRCFVRRVTVLRPNQEPIILVSNLVDAEKYPAVDLLEAYRDRVNIEYMFQRITEVFGLRRLIGTTPRATVFQLAYCFMLYNAIQLVRAYIAQANQKKMEEVSPRKLFEDIKEDLQALHRMLPRQVIEKLFGKPMAVEELRNVLAQRLGVWQNRWRKAATRPNRPPKPKGTKGHHSAYRILREASSSKK